jgi:hypothetical protein
MFTDADRSRLSMLRSWILEHKVTEIEMSEQQFWNFAQLQPIAEKPWSTFMGRMIRVADMLVHAQKQLGILDDRNRGPYEPAMATCGQKSVATSSYDPFRSRAYAVLAAA